VGGINISIGGFIFKQLDRFGTNLNIFWSRFRDFFYSHKTIFDIFFLVVYAFEQIMLFALISLRPDKAAFIVGVFVTVFLTTIGLERICMSSRLNESKELADSMGVNYLELLDTTDRYEKVINELFEKDKV